MEKKNWKIEKEMIRQRRAQLEKEFKESLPEMQNKFDAIIQYVKDHEDAFASQRFISYETWSIIRDSEKTIKELTCGNWHGYGDFIFGQANAFEKYVKDKTGDKLDYSWNDGNVCLHHFTEKTPERMVQEQAIRMSTAEHIWIDDFISLRNGQIAISPMFERDGIGETNEQDALYIKDRFFDDIKKRFENIVTAANLIKDFTQNQAAQCEAHYSAELEKAQIYHEDMQKRIEAIKVREEQEKRLDELTDSLSQAKSFDEMRAMAKEIKELKNALQKEDSQANPHRRDYKEREAI
jgi:hypothetical protein